MIYQKAGLAGLTVVLTIVILFAMTAAWYTNIVQTSGLVFEAEAWGFDGNIIVDDTPITAAPGDNGNINVKINNEGDSIAAVSVNVSKTGMLDQMQKRLFFYVDAKMNRNGETMDRIYLNNSESYTYTLFSKGNLTLTDQISNGPRLKWQWVYDVLGYYVLAQKEEVPTQDGTGTVTKLTIKEYLRPIEYDFDKATKTVHTEGDTITVTLDTVDGKTEPEIYLWQISQKDGYAGVVNPEKDEITANGRSYYAVDVDEKGYGIYAYLCSYSDIEMETAYDTKLGNLAYQQVKGETLDTKDAELLSHTATLIISAQKGENTVVSVNTLNMLEKAIEQNTADMIQLNQNVTIPADKPLTIPKNKRVMLDLNGNTITGLGEKAVVAEPGSSLTMINGSIQGIESEEITFGIHTTGAEVVMSDVDVNGFRYGVYLGDHLNKNELDSRIHMVGCEVNAEDYAVVVSGNGLLSDQKTQVIIDGCTLRSNGTALSGNGDVSGNGRWGTDIQIVNSTIIGESQGGTVTGGGIYHPQKDSTLLIHKSKVTGFTGVAIKGGTVTITDSEIEGNGEVDLVDVDKVGFVTSGYADTGDAVYIETNYGYEIVLNINGNSALTSQKAKSLRVYEFTATNVSVNVESGKFYREAIPDAYLAEGSTQSPNGDGYYYVIAAEQ